MESILIISEKNNHEVKSITSYLSHGSWFHLVLDEIHSGYEICLNVSEGTFNLKDSSSGKKIVSSQLRTVWLPRLDNMYEEGFRNKDKLAKFFSSEYFSVIEGLIACAEQMDCLIVTHPDVTYSAGNKVRQQLTAAKLGMLLPEQIITNRKKYFLQQAWKNRSIFKPVHSGNLHYDHEQEQAYMSKPVIISKELLSQIRSGSVEMTVHYFQERLEFIAEYRVVVFGDHVFPFKITGSYDIDWRNYMRQILITYQKDFIYSKECLAYNHHFNLTLGCFDFIETKSGMYFIECNPPGYIQFCDPENKAGMLEAFAAYLTR